jgi:hypothetical protein
LKKSKKSNVSKSSIKISSPLKKDTLKRFREAADRNNVKVQHLLDLLSMHLADKDLQINIPYSSPTPDRSNQL